MAADPKCYDVLENVDETLYGLTKANGYHFDVQLVEWTWRNPTDYNESQNPAVAVIGADFINAKYHTATGQGLFAEGVILNLQVRGVLQGVDAHKEIFKLGFDIKKLIMEDPARGTADIIDTEWLSNIPHLFPDYAWVDCTFRCCWRE